MDDAGDPVGVPELPSRRACGRAPPPPAGTAIGADGAARATLPGEPCRSRSSSTLMMLADRSRIGGAASAAWRTPSAGAGVSPGIIMSFSTPHRVHAAPGVGVGVGATAGAAGAGVGSGGSCLASRTASSASAAVSSADGRGESAADPAGSRMLKLSSSMWRSM